MAYVSLTEGTVNAAKKPDPTKKNVTRVTTNVTKRKKSFGRKVGETLSNVKGVSLKETVVDDIVMPSVKGFIGDTIINIVGSLADTVSAIVDIALWGEVRDKKRNGYKSYDKMYSKNERSSLNRKRERDYVYDYDDIVFDSKFDARDVLDEMIDICTEYGSVSVSDYYEMVGEESVFTDQTYGWTSLAAAHIARNRDGKFVLNLPKARLLT